MKKITALILLFFSMSTVSAKTYYSTYSTYSDYQTEPIEESDTISVDKLTTNHYYKEEYIYSDDYYLDGLNPMGFPYKSTEFIEVSKDNLKERPEEIPGREIFENTIYNCRDVLPVRYIRLSDAVNYTDITVKDNNNKIIDYDIVSGENIIIDLKDYYIVDKLVINVDADTYKLEILRDLDGPVYYSRTFNNYNSFIVVKNLRKINPEYGEKYIRTENNANYDTSIRVSETVYSYVDKLYKYYDIKKIYNPEFFCTDEFNLSGEEITLYRYKTRDKLEIMDNIVITDENNIRLEDIILFSSTPYKIFSNLDLAVNGQYNVTVLTDFKEISTEIIVDKKSNIINALVKEMELNNELKKEVNHLNSVVNEQYMDIKNVINITNEQIHEVNNKLLVEKEKNKQLSKDKQFLKDVSVEKKLKKQVFLPICFIIIFLISAYFYLKKSMIKDS